MKLWHIAALVVGVGFIMVIIRQMQSKQMVGTGATSNDAIVGLSKFGSGLLDLGGKIFAPSAAAGTNGYGQTGGYQPTDNPLGEVTGSANYGIYDPNTGLPG